MNTLSKVGAVIAIIASLIGVMSYFATKDDVSAVAVEVEELEVFAKQTYGEIQLEQTEQKIDDFDYRMQQNQAPPTQTEMEYRKTLERRREKLMRQFTPAE